MTKAGNEIIPEGHTEAGGSFQVRDKPFFWILLIASFVGGLYALLAHGLALFKFGAGYLPLILPLAVTVLSIFTRASEIRSSESVLKFSNDLAIGIISFDIWAISASRSDPSGRVLVNPNEMISGEFVLPFLLAGMIVAVGCVVITNINFNSKLQKQRWLLGALCAAALLYVAPFGVLEAIPEPTGKVGGEEHRYTVVIPYQDPGILRIAPTILRERFFAHFAKDIEAPNPETARTIALKRFTSSDESDQFKGKGGEKVQVQENGILLIPTPK